MSVWVHISTSEDATVEGGRRIKVSGLALFGEKGIYLRLEIFVCGITWASVVLYV